MSEAVRRMKCNRALEQSECPWCSKAFSFGEDVAVCTECETAHHDECWNRERGCSVGGCVNEPLKELERPAATVAPADSGSCPHCGSEFIETSAPYGTQLTGGPDVAICMTCKKAPTPDGIYRGPKVNAPGAVSSLVWGILGLFICGVIFGLIAIFKANEAKRLIKSDPRFSGDGMATAGRILGIVALVFWGLGLIVRFSGL